MSGIPTHSGHVRSDECPVIGCAKVRTARAQLDVGCRRRVVTGCEAHIGVLVSRAMMRLVSSRGHEAVVGHIDGGYTDTHRAVQWYGTDEAQDKAHRRCCK